MGNSIYFFISEIKQFYFTNKMATVISDVAYGFDSHPRNYVSRNSVNENSTTVTVRDIDVYLFLGELRTI